MKNNITIFIFVYILYFCNQAYGQEFIFNTNNIEILKNENLINSGKGEVIIDEENIIINAERFQYNKNDNKLKAWGNGIISIKSDKIDINFDQAIIDQNNLTIIASGNLKIKKTDSDITLRSEKILYDRIKSTIVSDTKTKITNSLNGNLMFTNFIFKINENLIKVKNLTYDDLSYELNSPLAYVNTDSKKLIAKDMELFLDKTNLSENMPRLRGNSIEINGERSEIINGVFTNCKPREGCPPWQMSAKKIAHDKKKQTIYYDDAVLKVYDFPVLYFPKFFHPDPTVKRRSGFLVPSFKSSENSNNYLSTPYFFALAENKDATLIPRFYDHDKILAQTEFRQIFEKSQHTADLSYFIDNDKQNNNENHFFYEYFKENLSSNFEESEIELKIQSVSENNYLRKNKLKSNIIDDYSTLENSIKINLSRESDLAELDFITYKNLNKQIDQNEYIFPRVNLVKDLDNKTKLNGDFTLQSVTTAKNYNSNIYEYTNINDLNFNSNSMISKYGTYNNFEFLVKNTNSDSKNSKNYKNNKNIYISNIAQYNLTLPMTKETNNFEKILNPKISIRMAPEYTKDESQESSEVDIDNVFSLNRLTNTGFTEGGFSLIWGNDYSIINKDNSKEIFKYSFANNLRLKENNDLPNDNQMNKKTSNLFNKLIYSPSETFDLTYKSSIKNNLEDINYENFIAKMKINNFVTTFDYINQNKLSNPISYVSNTTEYFIDEKNSFKFSTRKNKTDNLTEYYNIMYQYKNDCLAASIEYNKDFYNDNDLQPDETLFFKLTIIPFGESSTPDLKN